MRRKNCVGSIIERASYGKQRDKDSGAVCFRSTEFDIAKAWKELHEYTSKSQEGRFSNADSIRNLEDDAQLALKLWHLPKFESVDALYAWLCKEYEK